MFTPREKPPANDREVPKADVPGNKPEEQAPQQPEIIDAKSGKWADVARALELLHKVVGKMAEEDLKSAQAIDKVGEKMRIESSTHYNNLINTLRAGGRDESHVRQLLRDIINLAGGINKEYFVHQLTDSGKAFGDSEKIHQVLQRGIQTEADTEKDRLAA